MIQFGLKSYSYNTIVVGTGAAGYNAADSLYQLGVKNIVVLSERILSGTSRNTGSDKQTYYKLSLFGDSPDSIGQMAQSYFDGKCMDGEHALIESALSARCFFKLVNLGIPFPHNAYGEYVGYKTDHDSASRGTSVGPYTSKMMTECLEKAVLEKGIEVLDNQQVVRLLRDEEHIIGLITYNSKENEFSVFFAKNIILATGGPAGMYASSVYPASQFGATGFALEIGATGKNLTEWQSGLASVSPRWNVSGSYMQVIPRFVSKENDGSDEREFLYDYLGEEDKIEDLIFFKGYQWPFDVRKIISGSSIIDVLVYIERFLKNRRVYLDFTRNSGGKDLNEKNLSAEAYSYIKNAGVCFGTPVERLKKMNMPAYKLFLEKGIDIEKEMLEINLCIQHNNGGLSVDENWETNIKGLYAVGEVAGTHGVYRPGGSALNSGQVGSLKAALSICKKHDYNEMMVSDKERAIADMHLKDIRLLIESAVTPDGKSNLNYYFDVLRSRMSQIGAAIRDKNAIEEYLVVLKDLIVNFSKRINISGLHQVDNFLRLRGIVISQYVYLAAMLDYAKREKGSRGSALYSSKNGDLPKGKNIPELLRFQLEDESTENMIQEITLSETECSIQWRNARSIPFRNNFFENVWKEYNKFFMQ